jgi:DNA-binding NarL/FixJ family response regulator
MGKIKVLIVDDNEVVREGLKSILEPQTDIDVIGEAVDGLDAVVQAEKLSPDIILMDAHMPGIDGTEATRRIKMTLPAVKVLFLTVYGDYVGAALDAGASWYLTKDCRRQDLLEAIRVLARSTRARAGKAN